jgi:hypothetical protein
LAAGFLAAGFLAAGFLAAGFLAAGFLAATFLAAGFLAATFLAAGFLAAGFFVVAIVFFPFFEGLLFDDYKITLFSQIINTFFKFFHFFFLRLLTKQKNDIMGSPKNVS